MIFDALPILAAAPPLGVWSVLLDILVLLAAALVLGTIAERLGQSVIVGYLIAGTLVGRNVLGWISTQGEDELLNIAEMGVALLLFAIGLEFSPRRLLTLGNIVLKTGPLQVVLTAVIGFAVSIACDLDGQEALVVGMMVAMSSTACVLRLLTDRAEIDSQHGRTALGVLLVQDVAVVPMMLLVSIMATGGDWDLIVGKLALALILAALLIGLFYVLFNVVAPRLMLLPTWRKNRDLPVLLAVTMATGSAWAAHAVGLSPAMGAFAAGVLLAMSPFATQIRADTRPLTTLMVTLFFASIGMFGDPEWLLAHWPLVIGIVLAIVVGKSLIIALLARTFGQPWRDAIASGLCLAQVGEFSFLLAIIAHSDAVGTPLIKEKTFHAMVSATILTLLCTPYLVGAAPWVGARCEHLMKRWQHLLRPAAAMAGRMPTDHRTTASEEASSGSSADSDLIVIIGFGPAGQRVAEGLMASHQDQMVAVDLTPDNIGIARRYGLKAHLGDATQREILERAGIHHAGVVVVTVPDPTTTRHLIQLVRDLAPDVFIVARCRYHVWRWELLSAGAHEVVDEEDQLGRRLAAQVRKHVGTTD
ncbi:MAG: cation:proton antiporter [Planctomycetes bacterium]|nr:cation:proton antiporter [Planctomycetota bacterium]